jgi:molybdopterin molybdotransferase
MKYETPPPKTLDEALDFIFGYLEPSSKPQRVTINEAIGRVLAEDIVAPASLPRFDNAAMDGYAVRSLDLPNNGARVDLKVVATIAAGQTTPHNIGIGEAARITTGAMLPKGAPIGS